MERKYIIDSKDINDAHKIMKKHNLDISECVCLTKNIKNKVLRGLIDDDGMRYIVNYDCIDRVDDYNKYIKKQDAIKKLNQYKITHLSESFKNIMINNTTCKLFNLQDHKNLKNQALLRNYEESLAMLDNILDKKRYKEIYNKFKKIIDLQGYEGELKVVYELSILIEWFTRIFLTGLDMPTSYKITKFLYDEKESHRYYDINSILKLLVGTKLFTGNHNDLLESLLNKKEILKI